MKSHIIIILLINIVHKTFNPPLSKSPWEPQITWKAREVVNVIITDYWDQHRMSIGHVTGAD